jgi:hypothetical protein
VGSSSSCAQQPDLPRILPSPGAHMIAWRPSSAAASSSDPVFGLESAQFRWHLSGARPRSPPSRDPHGWPDHGAGRFGAPDLPGARDPGAVGEDEFGDALRDVEGKVGQDADVGVGGQHDAGMPELIAHHLQRAGCGLLPGSPLHGGQVRWSTLVHAVCSGLSSRVPVTSRRTGRAARRAVPGWRGERAPRLLHRHDR